MRTRIRVREVAKFDATVRTFPFEHTLPFSLELFWCCSAEHLPSPKRACRAFPDEWILAASRSDDAYTVFGAQRIRCLLLSGGIVAPHFVREEPVFVTARLESHTQTPHAVGAFLHRSSLGVPVVKFARQGHLPGRRGGKGELSHAVSVCEGFIFEWLCFHFSFFFFPVGESTPSLLPKETVQLTRPARSGCLRLPHRPFCH